MWAIGAKYFLPQAFKSCLKCNKSPNLITLAARLNANYAYSRILLASLNTNVTRLKRVHILIVDKLVLF